MKTNMQMMGGTNRTALLAATILITALAVQTVSAGDKVKKIVVNSSETGSSDQQVLPAGQFVVSTDDGEDQAGQLVSPKAKVMTVARGGFGGSGGSGGGGGFGAAMGFGSEGDDEDSDSGSSNGQNKVVIREIDPTHGKHAAKELTWLGISSQEVTEALTAQLGLKPGQGLLIDYVSKDSPAAKADLQKNDVLVEFDGQMLVDSVQLRKLVQMHPEGDSVKLTFFRAGKKQSVSAKLVKKKWDDISMNEGHFFGSGTSFSTGAGPAFSWSSSGNGAHNLSLELRELANSDRLKGQMESLEKSLEGLGLDKEKMRIEIDRTMEQTRKAIQDAMKNSRETLGDKRALASLNKELAELTGRGMDVGRDSTIIIKNSGKSARSIVKTDDTGSYVIVANPDKHLTVHDSHGKMIFDGAIQSPADQAKVPGEIMTKVTPMLDQMSKGRIEIDEEPAIPAVPAAPAAPAAPDAPVAPAAPAAPAVPHAESPAPPAHE